MFFETLKEGSVFTAIQTYVIIDTFYLEAPHGTSVWWNMLGKQGEWSLTKTCGINSAKTKETIVLSLRKFERGKDYLTSFKDFKCFSPESTFQLLKSVLRSKRKC